MASPLQAFWSNMQKVGHVWSVWQLSRQLQWIGVDLT